jgi:ribosomal protein L31
MQHFRFKSVDQTTHPFWTKNLNFNSKTFCVDQTTHSFWTKNQKFNSSIFALHLIINLIILVGGTLGVI